MSVDVHAHVVPEEFPVYAGKHLEVAWPSTCSAGCGHRHIMLRGQVFRTVSDECWDAEKRLAKMDEAGIDLQALSPMPELLSYWFDADDGTSIAHFVNDAIAGMVDKEPTRFCGLGMLPLQSPERAVLELEALMRDGRFKGVEIGTNVNGIPIGDPRFDPVFEAAERLDAAVFVHALHPTGDDRLVGPSLLKALVSFPCETAFAAAGLFTGGILARYPNLRIAFSHGGGALASVLPRLQFGWSKLDAIRRLSPVSPREAARRCYYDTLVYDPGALRAIGDAFGTSQLVLGTDYPFEIQETDPVGALLSAGFSADETEAIRSGNARRFLALDDPASTP
jgi:aminocarboxymuconate-semialdehyde decarboxylase